MVHAGESLHVVGGVGPGVGVALSVGTAHAVHVAGLDATTQVLVEELGVLNAEVRLQRQAVDGLDVDIRIAEDAPRLVRVVASVIQLVHGVGNVRPAEHHRVRVRAVGIGDGDGGVLAHGGIGDAAVVAGAIATVGPLGNHEVFTHTEYLTYIIGGVQASGVATVEGVVHQTVLVDVVAGEHERALLAAVGNRGREVVGPGRGEHLVLPVGVGGMHLAVGIEILTQLGLVATAVEGMRGHESGVLVGRPVGTSPLLGVHHLILLGDGVQRGGVVHVHADLVALALLRGDDDDAIGGSATIDGGAGGILQHLYAFNVGGVQ